MNIYNLYLEKILNILKSANKTDLLNLPEKLDGINVEIPPPKFNCDISTNVAMILAKTNNRSPIDMANQISELIKKEDEEIASIEVVKPGFINIKFKNTFWNSFLKDLIKVGDNFGKPIDIKKNKYLLEFVSANPTGPLHVGHCRGAILGDVLSNLLSFNGHSVDREYYVNDHGNQILHFSKSIFFRIREILNNEPFPQNDTNLYPGDYLIDIAKNIIQQQKDLKFEDFNKISKKLTLLSVEESLKLIKLNLKNLGILHNKFTSEREIVEKQEGGRERCGESVLRTRNVF